MALRATRCVIVLCALAVSLAGCAQAQQASDKFWSFNDDTYKWMMKDRN